MTACVRFFEAYKCDHTRTLFFGVQRTEVSDEPPGSMGMHAVGKIRRIAPFPNVVVQCAFEQARDVWRCGTLAVATNIIHPPWFLGLSSAVAWTAQSWSRTSWGQWRREGRCTNQCVCSFCRQYIRRVRTLRFLRVKHERHDRLTIRRR